MKVAVTTFGADRGQSGISRYLIQLLQQWEKSAQDHLFDLFLFPEDEHLFRQEDSRMRTVRCPSILRHPLLSIAWHQWSLPRYCRRGEYDVAFLPAGNRRLPARLPCPTVGTVHDLSSLHVPGKYDAARTLYIRNVLPWLIRRLTRVLTVSESSKRDLVEHAAVHPDRVSVVPLAVDHRMFHPGDPEQSRQYIQRKLGLRSPYLLYVSRIEHPGKNHLRLIEAFEELKRRVQLPHSLVLAGSDWNGATVVRERAAASKYSEQICFTGFVHSDDLPHLYRASDLFVFPSLYEGFGLPIVEAMACGAATACSNTSSMPEVAADAARYFSPHETCEIVAALEFLLCDPEQRRRYREAGIRRAAGFNWEHTASATWHALQQAAAMATSRPPGAPERCSFGRL